MDVIRLQCSACQTGLKAPANLAGKTLKCPKCGNPIQIAAPAAAPEPLPDLAAAADPPAPLQAAGPLDHDAAAGLAPLPEQDPLQPLAAASQPLAAASQPLAAASQPLAAASQPLAAASQPLAAASQPLAAASQPLAAASQPLAAASQPLAAAAHPLSSAAQQCPHCLAQIPAQARKCRHCGEFVGHAAQPKASGAAAEEKLERVEYVAAVLLAPVSFVLGLIWLLRGSGKASRMLLISGPVALLMVGGLFYWVFNNPGAEFSDNDLYTTPTAPRPPADFPPGFDPSQPPVQSGGSGRDQMFLAPPTDADLRQQPPVQQRAMRANVRIEVDKGGGRALGSGVIFRIEGATALIVTNRHVVDAYFADTQGAAETPLEALPPASVTYVTSDTEPAKVLWVAPNGVDLAVIKSPCPDSGVAAALWNIDTPITQGQDVFAVGNPAGLGWTMTRGTVSALRRQTSGKSSVPVIQTDAAISPGNSGGGLYTQDGMLIGINDFIINPALASNAGFAIRFELLDQLHPGGIEKFR